MRNPTRGWIATANNKHVGDDYPYPISHYYLMPDRSVRIQDMITANEKYGVKDFEKMQADNYMVLAEEWTPLIVNALSDKKLSATEKKALSVLQEWDFVARADGIAPTVFHATLNEMVKNSFNKRLGDQLYEEYIKSSDVVFNALRRLMAPGQISWFDDPDTSEVEGVEEMIAKSFRQAVAYLEGQMGDKVDNWQWGNLHTLTFYHPFGKSSSLMGYFLNIGPFPMGGSFATVNPQPYRLSKPWEVHHGASLRYIIDFSNMKNSLRVIPTGISGNFMSPHYDDQVELWRTGRYRPFVLDRESVEKDARYTLKMFPG